MFSTFSSYPDKLFFANRQSYSICNKFWRATKKRLIFISNEFITVISWRFDSKLSSNQGYWRSVVSAGSTWMIKCFSILINTLKTLFTYLNLSWQYIFNWSLILRLCPVVFKLFNSFYTCRRRIIKCYEIRGNKRNDILL